MKYGVIVVGVGPAGALLAYQLAKHGLKVLILEKASLPRYKACGGGLTLKTILEIPFDISPILERRAVGGILSYRGRRLKRFELARPVAWLVMRDRFHSFLVERAVAAGAVLFDGTVVRGFEQDGKSVQVWTSGGSFKGLLLAGADGVNSRVAKGIGLQTERMTGVAIEAELGVPAADLEDQGAYATFDFGAVPGGYAWIFPKSDHLSVGVFQTSSRKARDLKESLERFIANQHLLKEHRKLKQVGHRVPLGSTPGLLHAGRVLLLGDAANLADPWLG